MKKSKYKILLEYSMFGGPSLSADDGDDSQFR